MAHPLPQPWTVEDFLEWEAQQLERYEFLDGVIYAMVGGSNAHTAIKTNVVVALHGRLRGGPCRALTEGAKIVARDASLYPDAVVVCGGLDLADDKVHEPVVLAEVLSRSTADRDRSAKWVAYRELPSLRHYMLVAQDRRRVEVFSRDADRWSLEIVEPPAAIVALPAVGAEISLDEIYADSGR